MAIRPEPHRVAFRSPPYYTYALSQMTVPEVKSPGARLTIPKKLDWKGKAAALSLFVFGKAYCSTWRLRFEDHSGAFTGNEEGPVLFSVWHNRLAISMVFYHNYVKLGRKAAGLAALISASSDGALLSETLAYFGVKAARGSSSRRGPQALLELTTWIEKGWHVAITPDGPRGPKYIVQGGIISLAQLTGVPIIPLGAYIHRKKCLRSWDQFQIPLPFTRCDLKLGKPLWVPGECSAEERQELARVLQRRMEALNPD